MGQTMSKIYVYLQEINDQLAGALLRPAFDTNWMVSEHWFPAKRRCRKSLIVMSEQADWGAAPDTIVSKILWLDDLQTLDRLRCQNVCQTWKSLLHERPSAFERGDWSTTGHLFIQIDRCSTEMTASNTAA